MKNNQERGGKSTIHNMSKTSESLENKGFWINYNRKNDLTKKEKYGILIYRFVKTIYK